MDEETKELLKALVEKVNAIKGWITFIGIVLIIGLIVNGCEAFV